MTKFRIIGCNKESGEDVDFVIEATTYLEAQKKANQLDCVVSDVKVYESDKDPNLLKTKMHLSDSFSSEKSLSYSSGRYARKNFSAFAHHCFIFIMRTIVTAITLFCVVMFVGAILFWIPSELPYELGSQGTYISFDYEPSISEANNVREITRSRWDDELRKSTMQTWWQGYIDNWGIFSWSFYWFVWILIFASISYFIYKFQLWLKTPPFISRFTLAHYLIRIAKYFYKSC